MKKKIEEFMGRISDGEYTAREIVLSGITLFLLGMLLGILFSPKKNTTIGSNNGNNNTGSFGGDDEDCEDKE